jgi:hypothetical protein
MTGLFFLIAIVFGLGVFIEEWGREKRRERRKLHYRQDVLPSDEWNRRRYSFAPLAPLRAPPPHPCHPSYPW